MRFHRFEQPVNGGENSELSGICSCRLTEAGNDGGVVSPQSSDA